MKEYVGKSCSKTLEALYIFSKPIWALPAAEPQNLSKNRDSWFRTLKTDPSREMSAYSYALDSVCPPTFLFLPYPTSMNIGQVDFSHFSRFSSPQKFTLRRVYRAYYEKPLVFVLNDFQPGFQLLLERFLNSDCFSGIRTIGQLPARCSGIEAGFAKLSFQDVFSTIRTQTCQ